MPPLGLATEVVDAGAAAEAGTRAAAGPGRRPAGAWRPGALSRRRPRGSCWTGPWSGAPSCAGSGCRPWNREASARIQGVLQADAVVLAAGLGVTALLPGAAHPAPEGPSRHHGPGARPDSPPAGGAGLPEERPRAGQPPASPSTSSPGPRDSCSSAAPGSSRASTAPPTASYWGGCCARRCPSCPASEQVPVLRTWTGFRPCGPGNLPVIGPWPGQPGLLVAAGHEGLGITTALVTAELIAHHLLGTPAYPGSRALPAGGFPWLNPARIHGGRASPWRRSPARAWPWPCCGQGARASGPAARGRGGHPCAAWAPATSARCGWTATWVRACLEPVRDGLEVRTHA